MAHCQKDGLQGGILCAAVYVWHNVIATEVHRSRGVMGDLPAVGFIQCVLHCGDLFVDLKGIKHVKHHR